MTREPVESRELYLRKAHHDRALEAEEEIEYLAEVVDRLGEAPGASKQDLKTAVHTLRQLLATVTAHRRDLFMDAVRRSVEPCHVWASACDGSAVEMVSHAPLVACDEVR